MRTRILDTTLLRRLEEAWQAQGAEIATVLAPGIDDQEIDALLAPRNVRLPDEARRWWGWHDGTSSSTVHGWDLGAYISFYSLRQALEILQDPLGGGGEEAPMTWLPVAKAPGGPICIDCAAPAVAEVHRVDYELGFRPGAPSMGEMVALWLEMYETGAWAWNAEAGHWERHHDKTPPHASDMYVI